MNFDRLWKSNGSNNKSKVAVRLREDRKTGGDAWGTIHNNQPDSILVGFFGGDLVKILLYFDHLE